MSNSWPLVPLGSVLTERCETPSPAALASGEIPIVSKIGFNDGKIQLRSGTDTKTGMILAHPGDLVVSGINAAKGAIAVYGAENAAPIAATIHYGAYIPDPEQVNISFLWWLLRSNTFREALQEYVPGGIKTELKAKRLLPVRVPIPPIPEQQRIVGRIEELAGKIERARELRRQSVAELALVIKNTITRFTGNATQCGVLGEALLNAPRNGWSARCDNSEGGTPILSLGAITGFRYRPTESKRTSEPILHQAHYWLSPGDLLISRSNTPELVGHAAIYNGTPFPCIYPDLMMRLNVDTQKADVRFVHYCLQGAPARDFIHKNAKGTSPTMKKISQQIVMRVPFPASTSLVEQKRIVAELDGLQAKVDAVKGLQAQTQAELDALLPSLLDRAFRGEL